MLGGFFWFRFNQERPLEPDLFGIILCQLEHLRNVVLLKLHIGVEERLITFPTAPENVIFTV